ncbi:hypothetical protein O6H91_01G166900 [Diphasiastrum complanatum]|uniref:Uncharacterized protein n=1 Tax=Diphasiastrum complanatum TaxID=34168 RepID=A0ACC2EYC3_DIPCM|nr:hypothetical protein O6H91_01G166900 [Diphasiastrum complanatum]
MSLPLDGYSAVPPGFRFHPTDEELVGYYLHKKVACKKIDLDVIREIDLYKMEPWDLQEKCRIGSGEQNDWYFFSHKDKKYPTGTRTNRATTAGFWKATGRDKAIFTKRRIIGLRKTLVFYKGRAPNGQKTDWIMHEYRLEDETGQTSSEDGWVVCRVFKKRSIQRQPNDHNASCNYEEQASLTPEFELPEPIMKGNSYYRHALACKQEFDFETYEPHSYPFSKLPQLESPESCSDAPFLGSIGLTIVDSSRELIDLQPIAFEPADIDSSKPLSAVLHHQHFTVFHDDEVTEWSVVDRLLAEQLNQQPNQKEKPESAATDEGDLATLVRLSKSQQLTDYSSVCDGDLWSFGK